MSASDPTPMEKRPPIERVTFISAEGNPHAFDVGSNCSEIRETLENGEFCLIPWLEIWTGDTITARICQHKVEHILYASTTQPGEAREGNDG